MFASKHRQNYLSSPLYAGFVALFMSAAGCASTGRSFEPQAREIPIVDIETAEQQAFDAMMSAPTTFDLPASETTAAWARARLFFERYTAGYRIQASSNRGGEDQLTLINTEVSKDGYEYRVTRRGQRGGSRFIVLCTTPARTPNGFSLQNAHNLARFIREGQLELSLLKR